jgi:hypothetical protein
MAIGRLLFSLPAFSLRLSSAGSVLLLHCRTACGTENYAVKAE